MCNAGQEAQQTLHAGMLSFSCHLVDILCTSTLPSIPGLVVLAPAHALGMKETGMGTIFCIIGTCVLQRASASKPDRIAILLAASH